MLRVERLAVRVVLDDPVPALARAEDAAGAGDESWRQWVDEYRRGEALSVRLVTTLLVSNGACHPVAIEVANRRYSSRRNPQPPKIEQQVGEIVAEDFGVRERELELRGHSIEPDLLGQMYVHVELGHDARLALEEPGEWSWDPAASGRTSRPRCPS